MKKNVNTTPGSRKTSPTTGQPRLQSGQARLKAGEPNAKKSDAPVETLTFKGGLRYIILKYAHAHSAYIPLNISCETALAPVAGVWLAAFTRSKRANLCLSGSSIRLIRNELEFRIRNEKLLYVMNAYIYGVINTASLADALCFTCDFENYISGNSSLTASQRKILLKGFAEAKCSFNFWIKGQA